MQVIPFSRKMDPVDSEKSQDLNKPDDHMCAIGLIVKVEEKRREHQK